MYTHVRLEKMLPLQGAYIHKPSYINNCVRLLYLHVHVIIMLVATVILKHSVMDLHLQ